MKLGFLVVVGLVACGKVKPEQASGSGSASAVVAPPTPVASIDAAPPPIDAPDELITVCGTLRAK